MISAMVSLSSKASSDSMALRWAMKPAGPPQSSGGHVTVAPDAARVGRAWLGRQMVLDPDLVPPRNVQVVLVGKSGALAQPQRRQRHLGRECRQLPRAIAHGTQTELIKVDALPPHRDLDHTVQLTQRAGARHL